jgi:hypothetical protein
MQKSRVQGGVPRTWSSSTLPPTRLHRSSTARRTTPSNPPSTSRFRGAKTHHFVAQMILSATSLDRLFRKFPYTSSASPCRLSAGCVWKTLVRLPRSARDHTHPFLSFTSRRTFHHIPLPVLLLFKTAIETLPASAP